MMVLEDSPAVIRRGTLMLSVCCVVFLSTSVAGHGLSLGSAQPSLGSPPESEFHYSGYTNPAAVRRLQEHQRVNGSVIREPEMYTMTSTHQFNDSSITDDEKLDRYFRPLIRVFTMDARCRTYEFVISFVLLGVTCLFGFVGNVLSILTLRRDPVKSVTTFLLSALAVADTVFLVPVVFVIIIPTGCEFYQNCPESLDNVIPILEQFGWGITGTCHTCTVYVTVLVAVHRYLWVCRLQAARRLSGFRRTKIQVAAIPVFALLYNSPRFFEYKVIHYSWNDTTSSGSNVIRRETTKILATVGRNEVFQIGYKNVLFIVFMYIVPLAILVMVSVNLIRTLKARRDTLRRIGSSSSNASTSRRDDNITLVLIIIIAAFIICQTPIMIQRLMLAASGTSGLLGCGTFYFYFEHFAYYMVLLNSSTNFVIYILFSPHFRQTLCADVLRGKHRPTGSVAPPPARQPPTGVRNRKSANGDEREALMLIRKNPTAEDDGHEEKLPNGVDNKVLLLPEVNGGFRGSAIFSNCSQTTNQELLYMSEDIDAELAAGPPDANCVTGRDVVDKDVRQSGNDAV